MREKLLDRASVYDRQPDRIVQIGFGLAAFVPRDRIGRSVSKKPRRPLAFKTAFPPSPPEGGIRDIFAVLVFAHVEWVGAKPAFS